MTPCSDAAGYQCFGRPCCLHIQGGPQKCWHTTASLHGVTTWRWWQEGSPKRFYPTSQPHMWYSNVDRSSTSSHHVSFQINIFATPRCHQMLCGVSRHVLSKTLRHYLCSENSVGVASLKKGGPMSAGGWEPRVSDHVCYGAQNPLQSESNFQNGIQVPVRSLHFRFDQP
jgi:hypothetical protein